MKNFFTLLIALLFAVSLTAQTLTVNVQGLPFGTNAIVNGGSGVIMIEVNSSTEWTAWASSATNHDGGYYITLTPPMGQAGYNLITVNYGENPYNVPFGWSIVVESKDNPMVCLYATIIQQTGGVIDMLGDQRRPDEPIINYPVLENPIRYATPAKGNKGKGNKK